MTQLANVVIVENPHSQFALEQMRNRDLGTVEFRSASNHAARALARAVCLSHREHSGKVVIAPILRAGLALEAEFMTVFPGAAVHHIGLERDEETFLPRSYYPRWKSNIVPSDALTIQIDPMNATGGSGAFGIRLLQSAGASRIIFVNVIASEEGVARIHSEFPEVVIYTLAVDPELDAKKYIVPGLGDYGDRYYGT